MRTPTRAIDSGEHHPVHPVESHYAAEHGSCQYHQCYLAGQFAQPYASNYPYYNARGYVPSQTGEPQGNDQPLRHFRFQTAGMVASGF